MKHLSLNLTLLVLFLFNLNLTSNAQTNCNLPGPANIWVISTSTNDVEIAWQEVPGAADYEIKAVEVVSGNIVSTQYTIDNTIIVTGLQPSTEYNIHVTSRCDNSLLGGSSSLRISTGIVVVDVIIQLNCVPNGSNTDNHPQQTAQRSYIMNFNEVMVVEGHLGNDPASDFRIIFTPSYNTFQPSVLTAGITPDYSNRVELAANNGNGQGVIRIDPNGPSSWRDLAIFRPIFGFPGELRMEWAEAVNITITRCSTIGNKPKDEDDIGIELSPNPTTGWFSILSPEDSPVTIVDLTGQVHYEAEVLADEPHEVDGSEWRNGTYIIRTILGDEVINTLLIKTE